MGHEHSMASRRRRAGPLQGSSGMWLRVSMERCVCCRLPYGADGGDLELRRETEQARSGGAMPARHGASTSPLRFEIALTRRASRGLPDRPRPSAACSAHSSLQLPHTPPGPPLSALLLRGALAYEASAPSPFHYGGFLYYPCVQTLGQDSWSFSTWAKVFGNWVFGALHRMIHACYHFLRTNLSFLITRAVTG